MSRTAWCGVRVCAGLELADGDVLVPGPDLDDEGAGAATQESVGAIIGPLQGRNDASVVHQMRGGTEEVPKKLLWQLAVQVVLARQRKNRGI